jgi:HD-GYP domain-containing protein (c-di-GMP phosphodiesterase class II)
MVFSTESGIPIQLPAKEPQKLFNYIIDQKIFRYSAINVNDFLCGIPIRNSQSVLGALVAFGRASYGSPGYEADKYTGDYHAVEMESFLSNLATLIEDNLSAHEEIQDMALELEQSFEDLYLYGQIASQIKTVKVSTRMLKDLIAKLIENIRVDAAFTVIPGRQKLNLWLGNPVVFNSIASPDKCFKKLIHLIPPDAITLKENYFIINDSQKNPQYKDMFADPYRFLAVKIRQNENSYGWLGLVSFNLKEIFRQGELRMLISTAEQLAGVFANTDLYQDLEKFIVSMVKSLVFAIEAKDIYTKGHSERVSKYSMLIGKRLGLDKEESNNLKWASILHDIGKIGIPESILNKPDRLTDAEFDIIKGHSVKGGDILQPIDQLADSLSGIIHHHERYDGGGYPQGLKGEEIPLIARIIAVADTFDAINSTRAYRETRSPEKAFKIIEEVSGSQLDSNIVDTFKKVYKEDLKL